MASANYGPSEDQFLCPICLEVFTDPVSTPCGHNFCMNCINEHWKTRDQNRCPICKKDFTTRPVLRVNTITDLIVQFRQSTQQKASSSSSEQQESKPGEVPCDVCTGTKVKALKSCLVCLASYCETHLEPHLTASRLRKHQLIEPVENLEGRMCTKHDKPLELFCKSDQMCVCTHCPALDHKMHKIVPLKEEYDEKNAELGMKKVELQQMIQRRELKIQVFKHSVKRIKKNAHMEAAESVRVFTSLKKSLDRGLSELIKAIEEEQKTTQKQAEAFIKELEREICELKKRSAELEKVSLSGDHVHLLQSFQYLNAGPPTKDWTEVSVQPPSYEGTVVSALLQLEKNLSTEMKRLFAEAELRRVQKFAVDVTLDPEAAHPELLLSDDGKQVKHGDVKKNLPNNPERFSHYNFVVAKQSFSSGRSYFEVRVRGKPKWILGVVSESVYRKGPVTMTPEDGYRTIWLRNGNEYKALTSPSVVLSVKSGPQKVGVFVDYEEGVVSFYDVEAAALIYSFTGGSFTEKLFPFFSPCRNDRGQNAAPLIISPVNQNV